MTGLPYPVSLLTSTCLPRRAIPIIISGEDISRVVSEEEIYFMLNQNTGLGSHPMVLSAGLFSPTPNHLRKSQPAVLNPFYPAGAQESGLNSINFRKPISPWITGLDCMALMVYLPTWVKCFNESTNINCESTAGNSVKVYPREK